MEDTGWRRTLDVYAFKADEAARGECDPHVPVLHLDLKFMVEELRELERIRRFFRPPPVVQRVTNGFWVLQQDEARQRYIVRLVLKTETDRFAQQTDDELFDKVEDARAALRFRGLVRHEIGAIPLLELWFPLDQKVV